MKKLLLLIPISMFAVGCSMEASLENLGSIAVRFQDPAKTTGLVSGSTQDGIGKDENNNKLYLVQSSVGNYMSGINQKTTDGAYMVYSSVQGAIVSPQ